MGFKCGILGLSNVGKSTVFNALTATAAAQASNYPFSTIEPNVGEVLVPDPRLDVLARLAKSAKIKPTRLTFVDIAGLVSGASRGEGLGNQFLAHVREVDAIAHVVRCFVDADVTHVSGAIDPVADIDTIETELMLADLDSLERRVDGLGKKAKGSDKDAAEAKETLDLVNRALVLLRDGKPARLVERKPEEEKAFHMLGLLTSLPVLYVCNVDEAAAATGNDLSRKVEARAQRGGRRVRHHLGQDRSRDRGAAGARARRISRRDRARGAGPRPADPRRLRAAQSDHLFHRRPQGGGGLDDHARHQGAAGGGRHPFRLRARLHPRRDHRLRRLRDIWRRNRRAARPARCGSRARPTWSPTATSCISGLRPNGCRGGQNRKLCPRCDDAAGDFAHPVGRSVRKRNLLAHICPRWRMAPRCSLMRNMISTNSAMMRAKITPISTPIRLARI